MKSSFATDLLGALGRVAARGGMASKLFRAGAASGLVRLSSRDMLLCASVAEDGIDEVEGALVWVADLCDGKSARVNVAAGVEGLVSAGFVCAACRLSESPRSGSPRSADLGGIGVSPGCAACLRRGSSKGLTSRFDPWEADDDDRFNVPFLFGSSPDDVTMGEIGSGREPARDLCFAETGTSCSLKPS